jgi:hypothetical protein
MISPLQFAGMFVDWTDPNKAVYDLLAICFVHGQLTASSATPTVSGWTLLSTLTWRATSCEHCSVRHWIVRLHILSYTKSSHPVIRGL